MINMLRKIMWRFTLRRANVYRVWLGNSGKGFLMLWNGQGFEWGQHCTVYLNAVSRVKKVT